MRQSRKTSLRRRLQHHLCHRKTENRPLSSSPVLKYPGTKEERWKKRKGFGYVDYEGESFLVDLHWYEEPTVGRVEFKVKPDAGGNWFYEEE